MLAIPLGTKFYTSSEMAPRESAIQSSDWKPPHQLFAQGSLALPRHLECVCKSERQDLLGSLLLLRINSCQGTKMTLFHVLCWSPSFLLFLIYSTLSVFFHHSSSLQVCCSLGIFPVCDWCHIMLMLVRYHFTKWPFPTLLPNYENLCYLETYSSF